jgi:hypothetical protein
VILAGIFFLCFGVLNRSKIPIQHHAVQFNLVVPSSDAYPEKGMAEKVDET